MGLIWDSSLPSLAASRLNFDLEERARRDQGGNVVGYAAHSNGLSAGVSATDVLTGRGDLDGFLFNADHDTVAKRDNATDLHAAEFAADLGSING